MKRDKGEVKIRYADTAHPQTLLKNIKRKRKTLNNFMKGKYSRLTKDQIASFQSMSEEDLNRLLKDCDKQIHSLNQGKWAEAKAVDDNRRSSMRAGKASFFNRGLFAGPSMNPIRREEKAKEEEKKRMEDL